MSDLTIAMRIILSAIVGGLIGFEREVHGRAAGLRTHMLVCVGSALFMVTSLLVSERYYHLGNVDPSRIAAGVVTGIGFLGAGAVLRLESSVKGLTTAASIWTAAAIGLALGAGFYVVSILTAVIVIIALYMARFKKWLDSLKRGGK